MQQLSGSSGRGRTFIPSTVRIFSGGGGGRAAGPANLDPKMMPLGGVGGLPAPVVRPDSSSIRAAIPACSCNSSSFALASATIAGKGLSVGFEPTGCWIDTGAALIGGGLGGRYGRRSHSLHRGIGRLFVRGSSDEGGGSRQDAGDV